MVARAHLDLTDIEDLPLEQRLQTDDVASVFIELVAELVVARGYGRCISGLYLFQLTFRTHEQHVLRFTVSIVSPFTIVRVIVLPWSEQVGCTRLLLWDETAGLRVEGYLGVISSFVYSIKAKAMIIDTRTWGKDFTN